MKYWYLIDFITGTIEMCIFGRETIMPLNKYTLELCEFNYTHNKIEGL